MNFGSLKPGKVVIVLNGRYAGKKGVIVKTFDDGVDTRKYGHAVVAGIAREPLKVTKSMPQKKVDKRSRIKPFLKTVNFNHLMPTRLVLVSAIDFLIVAKVIYLCILCFSYSVEVDFKAAGVTSDAVANQTKRTEAQKAIKKLFQERYTQGKNKWFFSKLRF